MPQQRAFWKGYLKLSLVTCRVTMTPAVTAAAKLRFRNVDRRTGHQVVSEYVDAENGKPVEEEDQLKGFPRGEGDYVLFEDEELDDVALESTRTIDIEQFVPASSIGWIWYDKPHYLAPADEVSEEAFSVIREAMAKTGTAGIARLVLYRREHPVLLLPRGKGMIVWTLRFGDEVRNAENLFSAAGKAKPSGKALSMMRKVIAERTEKWSPEMVTDPVEARLHDIIRTRRKGKKKSPQPQKRAPAPESNVIDIMSALRKSLSSERHSSRR